MKAFSTLILCSAALRLRASRASPNACENKCANVLTKDAHTTFCTCLDTKMSMMPSCADWALGGAPKCGFYMPSVSTLEVASPKKAVKVLNNGEFDENSKHAQLRSFLERSEGASKNACENLCGQQEDWKVCTCLGADDIVGSFLPSCTQWKKKGAPTCDVIIKGPSDEEFLEVKKEQLQGSANSCEHRCKSAKKAGRRMDSTYCTCLNGPDGFSLIPTCADWEKQHAIDGLTCDVVIPRVAFAEKTSKKLQQAASQKTEKLNERACDNVCPQEDTDSAKRCTCFGDLNMPLLPTCSKWNDSQQPKCTW
jgi:hypothetical protein